MRSGNDTYIGTVRSNLLLWWIHLQLVSPMDYTVVAALNPALIKSAVIYPHLKVTVLFVVFPPSLSSLSASLLLCLR